MAGRARAGSAPAEAALNHGESHGECRCEDCRRNSKTVSTKLRHDRLRSVENAVVVDVLFFAALIAALAGVGAKPARAVEAPQIVVKVGGKLPVPPTIPLGVIATDPVLQQVLSQDFQVAGRLASASATSELTLTVTLTHRALEPGMSLNEVAPGNGDAVALLKQAGVKAAAAAGTGGARSGSGQRLRRGRHERGRGQLALEE